MMLFGGWGKLWQLCVPARSQLVGSACAGTEGLPRLLVDAPYLGNGSWALEVQSARTRSACLFVLASRPDHRDLGGGCTLYVDVASSVLLGAATNAHGFGSSSVLPIPFDLSLRGVTLHAQAFVADPMGPVLGITSTAGRTLVLGD
jgi:hypothetical protein